MNFKQSLDDHAPLPADEVRRRLGVPDDATFVGYVVHLPRSDEFLSKIKKKRGVDQIIWAKTPVLAKRYEEFHQAAAEVTRYGKGSVVALLFDLDNHLMVGWSG